MRSSPVWIRGRTEGHERRGGDAIGPCKGKAFGRTHLSQARSRRSRGSRRQGAGPRRHATSRRCPRRSHGPRCSHPTRGCKSGARRHPRRHPRTLLPHWPDRALHRSHPRRGYSQGRCGLPRSRPTGAGTRHLETAPCGSRRRGRCARDPLPGASPGVLLAVHPEASFRHAEVGHQPRWSNCHRQRGIALGYRKRLSRVGSPPEVPE